LLSARVAVLRKGKIEEVGAPGDPYYRPRNRAAAISMGNISLFTSAEARRLGFALPERRFDDDCLLGVRSNRVRVAYEGRPAGGQPGGEGASVDWQWPQAE